jgi:putative DNA modification/repair radical SAM protein
LFYEKLLPRDSLSKKRADPDFTNLGTKIHPNNIAQIPLISRTIFPFFNIDSEHLFAIIKAIRTYIRFLLVYQLNGRTVDLSTKIALLADAAKYDVACTSSGVDRSGAYGKLGSSTAAGCCHSFTPDGRCISLLKILMTNSCIYDCAYCVNRSSNEQRRAAFSPKELADVTIDFYRRNYIEGLFLSSGVLKNPDYTMERMIETLRILREDYEFRGYIHAKAIPGAHSDLIDTMAHLADRISVNLELPTHQSLALLAPEKGACNILDPMKHIRSHITEDRDTRALMKRNHTYMTRYSTHQKSRAYAPAGQSTQMIIGASPENDYQILNITAALYRHVTMKRVFFSAYIPVNDDRRLPHDVPIPLNREHRLYQADWLMRFYKFNVDEVIDQNHPFLDPAIDPKANWALNHLDTFPVEVNTAPYATLIRIPGIGVKGARSILVARKTTTLRETELRKLGIAYKRARFFITCQGKYAGTGIHFDRASIRSQLAKPIDGGSHGRRSGGILPGQMSLFDTDNSSSHRLYHSASDVSHNLNESYRRVQSIKQPTLPTHNRIKSSTHTYAQSSFMQPTLHKTEHIS